MTSPQISHFRGFTVCGVKYIFNADHRDIGEASDWNSTIVITLKFTEQTYVLAVLDVVKQVEDFEIFFFHNIFSHSFDILPLKVC